jgi:hypothetical protein
MDLITITLALNNVTALIAAIQGFLVQVSAFIPAMIGVAAVIARFMPPPDQPGKLAKFHKVINSLGMNAGFAANETKGENV